MAPTHNGSWSRGQYTNGQSGQTQFSNYNQPTTVTSSWSRSDEKKTLQDIQTKFESYLKKVAELGDQSGSAAGSTFLTSIRNVEESVTSMKASYEAEIENLRRQIASFSAEKAELSASMNGVQQKNNQLSKDLSAEKDFSEKMTCEVNDLVAENNRLNQFIADLQLKIRQLEQSLSRQEGYHGNLHVSYTDLQAQLNDVAKRLEEEERMRRESEETAKQLQEKLDFLTKMKDQELGQLLSRLDGSQNLIMDLETKVRELTENEGKLPDLLKRVKEAADADLQQYRAEAEQEFTNKIAALNDKYAEDLREMGQMKADNDHLNATIGNLQGQINALQAQLNGALSERDGLVAGLEEDRRRHGEQINDFQKKLDKLNQMYLDSIKQVDMEDGSKVSLRAEMESLLVLLEEEEKKLLIQGDVGRDQPGYSGQGQLGRSYQDPTQTTFNQGETYTSGQYGFTSSYDYGCQQIGPVGKVSQGSVGPEAFTRSQEKVREGARTQAEADLAKLEAAKRAQSAPDPRPTSSTSHDYQTATNSQVAELGIHEVHPLGQYVRILNSSNQKELDISNYQIQQNVGGRPVAVFRFPSKTKIGPSATATVWCASSDSLHHQPPTDFICQQQEKWGTGPECTTILCKANGQAVAWCTAPHRLSRDAYAERAPGSPAPSQTFSDAPKPADEPPLSELPPKQQREPVFLQREKMEQPSLLAKKHPHGQEPQCEVHPASGLPRQQSPGNDNSSFNRQTRVYIKPVPDPIPVQYCGASAARLGSSRLHKPPTIRGSGRQVNKADYISNVPPPSSFMKPSRRSDQGMKQLQGQMDLDHQPPMPRPPLISEW